MTRVKICGITRLEDAELAASLGAWALGFILWPGSSRYVEEAVAAGIARRVRRQAELVGVFVNPTLDELAHAVDAIGLTHVQLHGEEGPAFATEAARRTGAKVIKAARVAGAAKGGEILVSSLVKELADTGDVDFGTVREVELKGFSGARRLHEVLWHDPPQV